MALVTPKFRGSYVTLDKPRAFNEGEPKYSITVVIQKDDARGKQFMDQLKKSIIECMTKKWGKAIKPRYAVFVDGDTHTNGEGKSDPNWANSWVLKASAAQTRKPALFEQLDSGEKIDAEDMSKFYSGAYFRASIEPYAWENKFGKGVSLSLRSVLFIEDGEPIGGGGTASVDEYADFDDEPKKPAKETTKNKKEDEPVVVTDDEDIFS